MATLADLFNQKSQDIYKRFAAKVEPNDQPYVSIIPDTNDSRSRIKDDNRAVPVVSIARDTARVSKFLRSSNGLLFIAKQTLLQTGNTFVDTKLYNPASPLLNTVPFLHIRRNIPTKALTTNASGLLQNTTVNDVTSKFIISGKIQSFSSGRRGLIPTIGSIAKTYLATQLKNAVNTIVPLPQNYSESRPEYKTFNYVNNTFGNTGPVVFSPQPLNQRNSIRLSLTATTTANLQNMAVRKLTNFVQSVTQKFPSLIRPPIEKLNPPKDIPTFVQAATEFRNKQLINAKNRLNSKYFAEQQLYDKGPASSVVENTDSVINGSSPSIKDPYNLTRKVITNDENVINYNNIIREQNKDIIRFTFRDANGENPVHFRALLSSIKESIKTQFNEQQYVGRTERFVTYGGVKRSVNLTFNIAAFSRGELDGVWTKINYLSGLTFPSGVKNGFMVPPLFKITIGSIYDNQPCYIESLDYDFLDETITFDINKEVPFAVNVNMQLSILEKRSKFFDSPFYKITEQIAKEQLVQDSRASSKNSLRKLPTGDQINREALTLDSTIRLPQSRELSRIDLSATTSNPDAILQRFDDLVESDYISRLGNNEPNAVMEMFRRKTISDASLRSARAGTP